MKTFDYYIVEGGHDADPDPEQAGRVRLRKMGAHGPDVKTSHLPFSQIASPASGSGPFSFNRPPAPGTIVLGFDAGESVGYAFPFGIPHGIHEKAPTIPGNEALPFLPQAKKMKSIAMGIISDIQTDSEDNRTGLPKIIKTLKERSEEFEQSLNDGIPTHGAPFPLAGIRNTPLEKITTALEPAIGAMDPSKLAGLGENFNLGQMLQGINTSELGLPGNLANSLGSISKMMPQDIISKQPEWGSMFGNLAQSNNILPSLMNQLKGATSFGSLMNILKGAQSPKFLQVSANSEMKTITIETPFGTVTQNVFANGVISSSTTNSNSDFFKKLQSISSIIGGILQGGPGKTLFSQGGTPLTEMASRMKDMGKQGELLSFMQNLSNSNRSKNNGRIMGTEKGNTQASRRVVIEQGLAVFEKLGLEVPFKPKNDGGTS